MEDRLVLAGQLADAAREITTSYFRSPLDVEGKADDSPVTIADRKAEEAMRSLIAQSFPDDGIVGEEFPAKPSANSINWVLDPIDGTRSFISGAPWYGTLIGVMDGEDPIIGIIDMPALGERWTATADATTLNGRPAACRPMGDLGSAILFATDPDMFDDAETAAFDALAAQVSNRRYGCDCYAYGLLASGHIDLVVEASMKFFDALALVPVVRGAGGVITGWEGEPITRNWNGRVLATATPELHKQAMIILNG